MKIIKKIKDWLYNKTIGRKIQRDFVKEVTDDFLYYKYKIIMVNELIGEYRRGEDPVTVVRKISDIMV